MARFCGQRVVVGCVKCRWEKVQKSQNTADVLHGSPIAVTKSLSTCPTHRRVRRINGYQEYHHYKEGLTAEANDKSESIAGMMSLFLGLTLLLRFVTDVLSDPYLKDYVLEEADPRTAARLSEALIVLSVVRKVSKFFFPRDRP